MSHSENDLFHQMMEEQFPTGEVTEATLAARAEMSERIAKQATAEVEKRLTYQEANRRNGKSFLQAGIAAHLKKQAELEGRALHVDEHDEIHVQNPTELSVDFWLKFPIRVRPLKFVPGRNRHEKRMFRKLADQQERGTITRGRQNRGSGGNLGKLNRLYVMLAQAGALKQADVGGKK